MTNAEPAQLHGRLQQQSGDIENLLQRVRRIETLDRVLHQWTTDPWLAAIRVANLRGDTLVVFADTAAAATMLRYRREDLLAYLRRQHGPEIGRLEVKVRPGSARGRV